MTMRCFGNARALNQHEWPTHRKPLDTHMQGGLHIRQKQSRGIGTSSAWRIEVDGETSLLQTQVSMNVNVDLFKY